MIKRLDLFPLLHSSLHAAALTARSGETLEYDLGRYSEEKTFATTLTHWQQFQLTCDVTLQGARLVLGCDWWVKVHSIHSMLAIIRTSTGSLEFCRGYTLQPTLHSLQVLARLPPLP